MRSRILLIFDVFRALFHVRGFQMETGESELRAFLLANDGCWPEVKLINLNMSAMNDRMEKLRQLLFTTSIDISTRLSAAKVFQIYSSQGNYLQLDKVD